MKRFDSSQDSSRHRFQVSPNHHRYFQWIVSAAEMGVLNELRQLAGCSISVNLCDSGVGKAGWNEHNVLSAMKDYLNCEDFWVNF